MKLRPSNIKACRPPAQTGSVILEALIGILIFSVGILALIGLQAASVKNSAGAQYRTEAGLYANELIGQMWISDKAALAANFTGSGNCTSGGANYRTWCNRVIPKVDAGTKISSGLPGATAPTVSFAGNKVTITITWRPSGSSLHRYVAVTNIN